MTGYQSIALTIFAVAHFFLLLPTLLYMLDKLNRFADRKHNFVFWIYFWPLIPFLYFRVWRDNRPHCHAFPMILWMTIVIVDLGGGMVLTMCDIIKP